MTNGENGGERAIWTREGREGNQGGTPRTNPRVYVGANTFLYLSAHINATKSAIASMVKEAGGCEITPLGIWRTYGSAGDGSMTTLH